jgi:hypothetical protein
MAWSMKIRSVKVIAAKKRRGELKGNTQLHRLLRFKEIFSGVDHEWAKPSSILLAVMVYMSLAVQPGSMEAGLLCEHCCLYQSQLKLSITLGLRCKCPGAEQTSSLQVVRQSSSDQDHANGNGELGGNNKCLIITIS